jgi:hypothetical protein
MIKHWPLKKGFANFSNEMVESKKLPSLKIAKWNGVLGRCIMITIWWFHTRFYVGWYYDSNVE